MTHVEGQGSKKARGTVSVGRRASQVDTHSLTPIIFIMNDITYHPAVILQNTFVP